MKLGIRASIDALKPFSRTFVERPRFAMVIAICLTIAGVMSICAAAALIPMFFSLFGIARDAAVGLSDSLSVPAVSSPSSAELIRSDTENGIVSLTSSLISDAIDAEISRRFDVSSSTELFCDASDPANVVIISALVTSDGDCDASAIQSYVTSLLNCPCEVILR